MRMRSTLAHDEHLKVEESHMSTGNVWDKRLEPRPSTVHGHRVSLASMATECVLVCVWLMAKEK